VVVAKDLVDLEDAVEELVVGGVAARRVLEEREDREVRRRDLVAHDEVAAAQQALEDPEAVLHALRLPLDDVVVRLLVLELQLDRVRRPLPDLVEPVDEQVHLGFPRRVGGEDRRVRVGLFEIPEDADRVDHDGALVVDHRDQALAADDLDLTAVVVGDLNGLDLQALVGESEGDALDVRRVGRPVKPDHRLPDSRSERSRSASFLAR
jgi:hypothetical protein